MKKLVLLAVVFIFVGCFCSSDRTSLLLSEVNKLEVSIKGLIAQASVKELIAQSNVQEQQVMLAGFGCSPEKPKEPVVEVIKPVPPVTEPEKKPESVVTSTAKKVVAKVQKVMTKTPRIVKVTKEGDTWSIKLNVKKLKKGQEVHLCIGYMYFPSNQVEGGTVKIKTGWTPPGNPRISAGVWNGSGYVNSVLVSG